MKKKKTNMAKEIRSIPTLKGDLAQEFVRKADEALANKGSVDFSKQAAVTRSILRKAKLL